MEDELNNLFKKKFDRKKGATLAKMQVPVPMIPLSK
jgi:hypothetical protein